MRKKFFGLLLFFSSLSFAQAQIIVPADLPQDMKVTFKVVDSLENVGIPHLSGWVAADTVESVFLTNDKGTVHIDIPIFTRTITIKIRSKFYRPYEKKFLFDINQPDLGKIILSPSEEMLAEVKVVGQRPVEQDIEKLTYKIKNASPTTSMENAILEVPLLSKSNGQLKVRGTKNAVIYLNGKRVSEEILKNLQVKEVLKVEVIETPPLSEVMDVDQAIVNIVTKKTDENQVQGNLSAGYGFLRPFISSGGMLTLKTPKFYASYLGNWYTQQQKGTWELTRQKENHSSVFLRQKGDAEAQSVIHAHNLQLFYDFNSSTTLSLNLQFFENENSGEEKLNVRFANKDVPSRNYFNISTRIVGVEIELSKKISEFSKIINTARFFRSNDYSLSGSDNAALQRNWIETDNDLQGNMYVYQLKHQWKPSFNRKVSLDYGILAVLNQHDAAFAFYQWNLSTKRLEKSSALSLDTRFRQERGMFFLTTTFPWRKLQWQVGTSIEHVRNHFSNSESTLQQNFYNVTPRLKWMKKTATAGSFAFSLSSFVKLPDFTLLNPYIEIGNPNSSTAGNLHLKKETHYRIELTHDIDFKEGFLTLNSSVYHQLSNNEIVRRTNLSSSSDSVLVRFYDNIRQFSKTGASVSLRGFLDSWFLNITLHAERYAFDSPFVPVQNRNGFVWGTSLNINKTLRKYEFRLNASYENFTFDANARVYRLPSMGFGISRRWWNERIDTSVGITDIFNTSAKRRQAYYDGIYHQTYRSFYSIRFINFSVTYNFGKQIMFFKSSHGIQHATEMKK